MKQKIIKKYKSEKGSVTVYVTISMIFLIIILIGIYLSSAQTLFKENADINEIIKSYDIDMEQIYQEKTKDLSSISLYKPKCYKIKYFSQQK